MMALVLNAQGQVVPKATLPEIDDELLIQMYSTMVRLNVSRVGHDRELAHTHTHPESLSIRQWTISFMMHNAKVELAFI